LKSTQAKSYVLVELPRKKERKKELMHFPFEIIILESIPSQPWGERRSYPAHN
jgi:hypothetical protein